MAYILLPMAVHSLDDITANVLSAGRQADHGGKGKAASSQFCSKSDRDGPSPLIRDANSCADCRLRVITKSDADRGPYAGRRIVVNVSRPAHRIR